MTPPLLPGFVEHHCHFRAWAAQQSQLDLHGASDIAHLISAIRATDTDWIRGFGLPDAVLTGTDIASWLPSDPLTHRNVAVTSRDGHALLTTPATLRALNMSVGDLHVDGGVVELDASGQWTGVLREESAWIVRRALPNDLSLDQLRAAISTVAARGVTTVHDMDGLLALRDWTALHDLDGQLDVRATVHLLASDIEHVAEARTLERDAYIRVGGLKLFADGTLGSGTALLHEPEIPRPSQLPRDGVEIVSRTDLESWARRAAALGLPLLVHAIGDRAVTNVIDALDATRSAWSSLPDAPRIEHAQLMRTEDMARCARLGIQLSVQPTMLLTDENEAEARWGSERTPRAYAYRSMHDAGCRLLFGSDAPIEDLDPLAGIRAAVLRSWHPEQRIDLDIALAAATGRDVRTAAAGRDAVVLMGDSVDDWRVVGTRLGNRWTYRADN